MMLNPPKTKTFIDIREGDCREKLKGWRLTAKEYEKRRDDV